MPELTIVPERLDAAVFAPYGEVLDLQDGPPVFQNPGLRSWRVGYEADGTTELMVIEFDEIPLAFHRLERHHCVSQCFLPLRGRQMVMVVAAPTGEEPPAAQSVRAFLAEPHQGILLHRSVWHALNRFPIGGGAVYALLTTRETQAELEAERSGGPKPGLTDVHDFSLKQTTFRIAIATDAERRR
jgi:ureidoglycolate lyase